VNRGPISRARGSAPGGTVSLGALRQCCYREDTAAGPERFQREVKFAARLHHPHILTVHDSGEAAGQLWFTMRYVEGEGLRDRVRRVKQLSADVALRIATEAARALDHAHRHGVVHRDFAGTCSTSAAPMRRSPPRVGQEAEALAAYRLAVLRATEDVENAFCALVKREAQVGILTQGESSFARARENSDAAYRGGVVSLIEVLDADSNLLQVRDAKAQAQTEAARAAVGSFRALGGGWDAPRVHGTAPTATLDEQVHAHRQSTR
jgi:protein kinase-like protein/outer membrane efflux protein